MLTFDAQNDVEVHAEIYENFSFVHLDFLYNKKENYMKIFFKIIYYIYNYILIYYFNILFKLI